MSMIQLLKRNAIDVSKCPEITFIDEDGLDCDGPKREFFYLLMKELKQHQTLTLFEGATYASDS